MRIFISILAMIVGFGYIAYSYVGTVFRLANDAGESVDQGDEIGAVSMIIDFMMSGEIPQLTGYLYGGALLIVLAVVNLLLNSSKNKDEDEPV